MNAGQESCVVCWCVGMYASGSTWLFNAAMKVAAAIAPDTPLLGRFVTEHHELGFLDTPGHRAIVKTHAVGPEAEALLREHADSIWITVRDPRDCVASLMLYQRYDFDAALVAVQATARFCADLAGDSRVTMLRYESGFIDDPTTLDAIGRSFGGPLAAADRDRIFAETRRNAVEALIAGIETLPTATHHAASGDVVDLATQWHRHHANRTGEVGRWRHFLTARQIAAIEHALQDWMADFGYRAAIAPYRLRIGKLEVR